jgi:hypothetical protein
VTVDDKGVEEPERFTTAILRRGGMDKRLYFLAFERDLFREAMIKQFVLTIAFSVTCFLLTNSTLILRSDKTKYRKLLE